MVGIDWAGLSADQDSYDLDGAGRTVMELYKTIVLSGKPDAELSAFEELIVVAGDQISADSANTLGKTYSSGTSPRLSIDLSAYVRSLSAAVLGRFREPLCAELQTNSNVVLLAPTIVTLLNLPVQIAAIAVPISALIARAGISGMCNDLVAKGEDDEFRRERLEIHRANLRYLEGERTRYLHRGQVPDAINKAIAFEERKIKSLLQA